MHDSQAGSQVLIQVARQDGMLDVKLLELVQSNRGQDLLRVLAVGLVPGLYGAGQRSKLVGSLGTDEEPRAADESVRL